MQNKRIDFSFIYMITSLVLSVFFLVFFFVDTYIFKNEYKMLNFKDLIITPKYFLIMFLLIFCFSNAIIIIYKVIKSERIKEK